MKKSFTFLFFLLFGIISMYAQTTELRGVTFSLGTGFNRLSGDVYSYSLTTDGQHLLKYQQLSKTSFVVSSILTVKLGDLGTQVQNVNGVQRERLVNLRITDSTSKNRNNNEPEFKPAILGSRLALNVGINLLEINSDNVSFNKSIDGGIGLGYYLTDNIQLALFYDLIRIRQLRDYVKDTYVNKPIPNGDEFYNALDENNNDLFYNKTFTGFSFKVIFSFGNKRPASGTTSPDSQSSGMAR